MLEHQFEYVQNLINTNPAVRELFALNNTVTIRYDLINHIVIFGTDTKKNCLCFRNENIRKHQ